MGARTAEISRKTNETDIRLRLDLDGCGEVRINTGVGFFDHMLTLLCRHALINAEITAAGDIEVDGHHTVEDVGICLGQALAKALGDKKGICRYGSMLLPMEEALARVALDLSGRPHLEYRVALPTETVGTFDTCLAREFLRALCVNAGINLHVDLLAGSDPHHCLEAVFKGTGRALREAVSPDSREKGIPSSKGVL
jgi:imidazoleglycerol-phosphate dehydratase